MPTSSKPDPFRLLWGGLMLLMALYLGYKYMIASPSGYCREAGRVIPDEEIFINYLDSKIQSGGLKLSATEKSARDYRINHPSCCHVNWSWEARFRMEGLFDALFADYGVLSIQYEMTSEEKKRYRTTHNTAGVLTYVDHCGHMWRHSVMTD